MNYLAYATVHVTGDSILLTKGRFEKVGKNKRIIAVVAKKTLRYI
jgi:hypothetical protein